MLEAMLCVLVLALALNMPSVAALFGRQRDTPPSGQQCPAESAAEISARKRAKKARENEAVAALDRELAALEELVRLQQDQVKALRKLRKQYSSGVRKVTGSAAAFSSVPPPPPQRQTQQTHSWEASASAVADRLTAADVTGELPGAAAARRSPRATEEFDRHMVPRGAWLAEPAPAVVEVISVRLRSPGGGTGAVKRKSVSEPGFVHIVAAAAADGTIAFHDRDGERIAVYDAGHSALRALSFDVSEAALLATGAADGSVRLHDLEIWQHGRRIAGRMPRPPLEEGAEGGEPAPPQPPPATRAGVGLRAALRSSSVATAVPSEQAPAAGITAVDIYFHRSIGAAVVAAGDEAGACRFYHQNGTLLASVTADNGYNVANSASRTAKTAPVTAETVGKSAEAADSAARFPPVRAMARLGQQLAVSDGTDVRFLSTATLRPIREQRCRGGGGGGHGGGSSGGSSGGGSSGAGRGYSSNGGGNDAVVTALAHDVLLPGQLYAGFSDGAILVFATRGSGDDPGSGTASCRHLLTLRPGRRAGIGGSGSGAGGSGSGGYDSYDGYGGGYFGVLRLSAVRGYLLAVVGDSLLAYNTTGGAAVSLPLFKSRIICGSETDETAAAAEANADPWLLPWPPLVGVSRTPYARRADVVVAVAARCQVGGGGGSSGGDAESFGEAGFLGAAEISAFDALLPYEPYEMDVAWLRMPLMAVGIGMVIICQVTRGRGRGRRSRFYGGNGSNGGNGDPAAAARFERELRKFESAANGVPRRRGNGAGGWRGSVAAAAAEAAGEPWSVGGPGGGEAGDY